MDFLDEDFSWMLVDKYKRIINNDTRETRILEQGVAKEYMHQHPDERDVGGPFGPEMMEGPRRRRKKRNPLAKLKDVEWNAYDETLKANFKSKWREDEPPDEEDE